jgi:Disulphide bond corrector protein DsbC
MLIPILLLASCATGGTIGKDQHVKWNFSATEAKDNKVLVKLEAQVEKGWHMYATTLPRDDGPLPTIIHFDRSSAFALTGKLLEPSPKEENDPNFKMMVRYHEGMVIFMQYVERRTDRPFSIQGKVEFMQCNATGCLPPSTVLFDLAISKRNIHE